jgi:hypothetical protein
MNYMSEVIDTCNNPENPARLLGGEAPGNT